MPTLRTSSIAFAVCCVVSMLGVVESAKCTYVDYTADMCRSSNTVRIESQTITKGSRDVRIKLGGQTEATWHCGISKESVKWNGQANQIRVNFEPNGEVQWTVYDCDDLSGPVEAGIECSDEAFSTACPGTPGSNVTCVFEVSTSTKFIDKTTTTAQVTGSLAKDVLGSATAEITGSLTQERSSAVEVTYAQKSYLLIPAGFKFCSFSDAESVKDVLAPTGFKWQCSLTKFVQTKLGFTGECSNRRKCDKRVCGVSGAAKLISSALPFAFVYLIASFMF